MGLPVGSVDAFVGVKLGKSVGVALGISVGDPVGVSDGILDGIYDGDSVASKRVVKNRLSKTNLQIFRV